MKREKINLYECDYNKFIKCQEDDERCIRQECHKDKCCDCGKRKNKEKENYFGR
ncbi:MAG: hypothetical protein ACRC1P_07670 [Cellulosilyticaceae bacterium]